MTSKLPQLLYEDLLPTRDSLRDSALIISNLQRLYIPKHPRQWQYGLHVNLRGLVTQNFNIDSMPMHASIDLVRNKMRLGSAHWSLKDYSPPELFSNVRVWLESQKQDAQIDAIAFHPGVYRYDPVQSKKYADALWWLQEQFDGIVQSNREGVMSPILLYPHHFDLSLAWFPFDDERQIAIGFSTGDEHIAEPYLYLTVYPQPDALESCGGPSESYWQTNGFSGRVLLYDELYKSPDPEKLFASYANVMKKARSLF